MNKLLGAAFTLACAGLVKVYGDYKYHVGAVDAMEANKCVVEFQNEVIKELCKKLKKEQEKES